LILKNLKVNTFRNLQRIELNFLPSKNLIFGLNGAGKTSVLEAIFLIGFGKSFHSVKKTDMVTHGEKQFSVFLKVVQDTGSSLLSAHSHDRFELQVNGKRSSLIEVAKYLYPLYFSSSNYHQYVESTPYLRRMVNRFIFGVDSLYMHYILCYNRALKQKNYLLKTSKNKTELNSWTKIMCEMAEKIMNIRRGFIDHLNNEIGEQFSNHLKILYTPDLDMSFPVKRSQMEQAFASIQGDEVSRGKVLAGPHLDRFSLSLNDKNLKFYSSGEKKIHLLMAYIAFIMLYKKEKNEFPVFLVDDYDTAIDRENIDFLMKHYPDMQIIATSVNKNSEFDHLIELAKEN
jgi:DNA replication and repair protein RecF